MDFAYKIPKEARAHSFTKMSKEEIDQLPFDEVQPYIPHILKDLHNQWAMLGGPQNEEEKHLFDHLPKFIDGLAKGHDPQTMMQDPNVALIIKKMLEHDEEEKNKGEKKVAFSWGDIATPAIGAGLLGIGTLGDFVPGLDFGPSEAAQVEGASMLAPEAEFLGTEAANLAGQIPGQGTLFDAGEYAAKPVQDLASEAENTGIGQAIKDFGGKAWDATKAIGRGAGNVLGKIWSWGKKGLEGLGIMSGLSSLFGGGSGGQQGTVNSDIYNPEASGAISSGRSTMSKAHYSPGMTDNLIGEERNAMEHRSSVEEDAGILIYAAKDLRMEQLREQVRASLEAWANSSNDPQNPESLPQGQFAVWWALYNAATKADDIATLSGILAAVPEQYHTQGTPQIEVPQPNGTSDTQIGLGTPPNPQEINEAKEAQPLAFNPGGSQPEQPGKSPGNLIPGALSSVQSNWKIAVDVTGQQANMPSPGIPAGAAPQPVPSVPPTTAETTGVMGEQTNPYQKKVFNVAQPLETDSSKVMGFDANAMQNAMGPGGQTVRETSPAGSNVAGFAKSMLANTKESNWTIVSEASPMMMNPAMMAAMAPGPQAAQQPNQSYTENPEDQSTTQGFASSVSKPNPPQQVVQKQQQPGFSTAPKSPILTTDGQMEGNNPNGVRISADSSVIPNKEQPAYLDEKVDEEDNVDPHEVEKKIKDKEGKVIEIGSVYELSNDDFQPELVKVASIHDNGVVVESLENSMQFFVTADEKPQFIEKKASMLSSREQDALINESGVARNLSDVRLSDSHYEEEYPKFHEKLIEAFDSARPLSNVSLFEDDSLFL